MSLENYIGISGVANYVDADATAGIKNAVWEQLNAGNHLVLKFERNRVSQIAIEAALEHEAVREGKVHVIIPATLPTYKLHLEIDHNPLTVDESEYLLGLLDRVEQSHPWTVVEVRSWEVNEAAYNQMDGVFVDLSEGGVHSFFVNREGRPVDKATLLANRRGRLQLVADYTVPVKI